MHKIIISVFFLFLSFAPINLADQSMDLLAPKKTLIFEDATKQVSIDDILRDQTVFKETSNLSRGFNDSAWWVKLNLSNSHDTVQRYHIVFEDPLLKHVDFYEYVSGNTLVENMGRNLSNDHAFHGVLSDNDFLVEPFSKKDIFVRVSSDSAILLRHQILNDEQFQEFASNWNSARLVVFIIDAALLTLAFILFLTRKTLVLAYFNLSLFGAVISMLGAQNLLFRWFSVPLDSYFITALGAILFYIGSLMLIVTYARPSFRSFERLFAKGLLVLMSSMGVLVFIDSALVVELFIGKYLGFIFLLGVTWIAFYGWRQRIPLMGYLFFGWLTHVVLRVCVGLSNQGIIQIPLLFMGSGHLLQVMLFSYVFAYRQQILDAVKHNQALQMLSDAVDRSLSSSLSGTCRYDVLRNEFLFDSHLVKLLKLKQACFSLPQVLLLLPKKYRLKALKAFNKTIDLSVGGALPFMLQISNERRYFNASWDVKLDEEGRVFECNGFIIDVTKDVVFRQQEQGLIKRLNLVMGLSKSGSWEYDLQTDKVKIDDFIVSYFGMPAAEIPVHKFLSYFSENDNDILLKAFEQSVLTKAIFEFDVAINTPKGRFFIRVGCEPQFNNENIPKQYIGFLQDITEQHNAQLQTQKLLDEREELARQKEAFASNISHELRNPMNGVLGMSEVMLADEGLDNEQRLKINVINSSAQHMMTLLNDILDIAKLNAGKLQIETTSFSLQEIIADVQLSQKLLTDKKGLRLEFPRRYEGPQQNVLGDPTRVRQLLFNFMSNALKFTDQGAISLDVFYTVGGDIRFEVHDTGVGIDPQKLDYIFERFTQENETTARRYGGTGLGLSICQQLVEVMHGKIGVESTLGKGSCFWFELPLEIATTVDDGTEAGLDSSDKESAWPQKIIYTAVSKASLSSVLLVDDIATNTMVLRMILQQVNSDLQIIESQSAEHALQILKENEIGLVISDIAMPHMDGYELVQAIQQDRTIIEKPITVACSGNFSVDNALLAINKGFDGFLPKPTSLQLVQQMMQELSVEELPAAQGPAMGEFFKSIATVEKDDNWLRYISKPTFSMLTLLIGRFASSIALNDIEDIKKIGLLLNTIGTLLHDNELKAISLRLSQHKDLQIEDVKHFNKELLRRAKIIYQRLEGE